MKTSGTTAAKPSAASAVKTPARAPNATGMAPATSGTRPTAGTRNNSAGAEPQGGLTSTSVKRRSAGGSGDPFPPGTLVRVATVHEDLAMISEVVEGTEQWLRVRLTKPVDSEPTERFYSLSQVIWVELVGADEGARYRAELKEDHPHRNTRNPEVPPARAAVGGREK